MSNLALSVIIPAKNEERFIGKCLNSITFTLAETLSYEIIVVDNESTDSTARIARENGAILISADNVTIASLRNKGASLARGMILLFLDADVMLENDWGQAFISLQNSILTERLITGSRCLVPPHPNWLEKCWFAPLSKSKGVYVNSGHLLIPKTFFCDLKGFREDLITAEDYDLCMRAMSAGGKVENTPSLKAVHLGYPKTLREFIKRERWHGFSDFNPLTNIIHSKIGLATATFLLLHLLLFFTWSIPKLQAIAAFSIIFLCTSLTVIKYKNTPLVIPVNIAIYYFYFIGRSLAMVDALLASCVNKHPTSPRR